ncbi:lysophospholipid acyltransferase family protein [Oleiagrimonas sp.]|jgi:putative hemolysin|uniref:lysophospholipid acyltransferase family protein n=1 Tax=Oleiagrimonas sp. TaxID=2010330 RepID=UPI00262AF997|nr:lysophospholipid acyltransferase family protein [Oleiagrimonas sp.]MDA3914735.1 lysophospholipid acyltransferase family protein [Oleiagrimonas sp.]
MLSIERSLMERLPWLANHPFIRKPMAGLLGHLAAEGSFNDTLRALEGQQGFDFVREGLKRLDASYRVTPRELEHIPAEGPLLVVANHPLGMVDALVLLDMVGSVRRDVRILGNDILTMMPALAPLLLPVDVFGKGAGSRMRDIYRALEDGQALIVFPAGEVSRMGTSGVRDGAWSEGFARIARRSGAGVLPVHIAARNSAAFYGMSMLAKPLATVMLPREAVVPRRRRIGLSVGRLIDAEELIKRSENDTEQAARLMRRHVYRLARGRGVIFGGQSPLAHPEPAESVQAALQARAEMMAELADGKQAWLLPGSEDCPVMREIGRLRELTFRRVGEGTGMRTDLDKYDAWYEHLVLWDPETSRIVGAYRFGHGGRILAMRGKDGLYSASLFDYTELSEPHLSQGLELGRSFIAPAYWRSRALDQLWRGIGLYLQRHPELRFLFGPVSLSVSLPLEAREWIVAAHRHYFGREGLAHARQPFVISPEVVEGVRKELDGLEPSIGLGRLRHHLDALGVSMPVLYRQYVDVVEPEGVQFLDFGEDPGFSGCVDGLVMLDLAHLKPGKRSRYLGQR